MRVSTSEVGLKVLVYTQWCSNQHSERSVGSVFGSPDSV